MPQKRCLHDSKKIRKGRIFRRNRRFVSRDVCEETLLVPVCRCCEEVRMYHLNPCGAFIWSKINGRRKVEDLCRAVIERFAVEPERAENDLVSFLFTMREIGAIE